MIQAIQIFLISWSVCGCIFTWWKILPILKTFNEIPGAEGFISNLLSHEKLSYKLSFLTAMVLVPVVFSPLLLFMTPLNWIAGKVSKKNKKDKEEEPSITASYLLEHYDDGVLISSEETTRTASGRSLRDTGDMLRNKYKAISVINNTDEPSKKGKSIVVTTKSPPDNPWVMFL